MKKQKIKSYIAAAMALSISLSSFAMTPLASTAREKFKKVIEFEDINKFSGDNGNAVRSDLFNDYSGNGYVYLTSGWAEVDFDIPADGKYKITIVSTSDQDKENWLYLDNDGVGKLYTQGEKWTETTNEYTLSKGSHKFGVSSDWGYVALDYVIVEEVDDGSTENPGGGTESGDHGQSGPVVDLNDDKTTIQFEDANRFSTDYGNKIANDQFSGYTGNGYVYLASGWAEVGFNAKEAGKYKITVNSNSDQDKENNVYLDDKGVGTLKTKANKWNSSEYTVDLSAGEHKFGVSTNWGYVALDSVTIEKVGSSTTPVTPPSQSEGSMYVDGTVLRDGKGNPFVMRGVNLAHAWYTDKTKTSIDAVSKLGANTVRVVLADGTQWTKTTREEVENIIKWTREKGLVCVLEVHDHTGFDEPSRLQNAVNYWEDMVDLLNANKDYVIVNVANEWLGTWGKGDVWTSTYTKAVKELRDAGLENVIMVDAAGYGQETSTLINNCQTVKAADPTGNIMFSIHMYSVAGKDADTVKSSIDSMLGKGVCTCIGEFGDYQNGADVDEETIINYSEEKKMGTIAWSWKGNGGQDMSLDMSNDWEGNDLTQWGKYAFNSTNGIHNTSKLAYTLKTPDGTVVNPEKPDTPNIPSTGGEKKDPDADIDTNIKPGLLSTLKNWYVSSKGDDTESTSSTLEELKDGGCRVSFDLSEDPYPYLVNMTKGVDFSKNNKVSVIVRNNTSSALQIQPIFKVGDLYDWTEYAQYKEVPALTAMQLDFDLSKCPDKDAVNAILFRIQGAGSKVKGSMDFLNVSGDLDTSTYKGAIAELNRPKTASYFSWAYPEASWKDQTSSATCSDDGVLSVAFKNVTSDNAAGIQTETKPGLGKGIDCSSYKTLKCKITNKNTFDISASLLLRSSSNWTWQENAGVTVDGKACDVIPAGKTVEVSYKLQEPTWKSKASNWEYTGEGQDLDDVRAIGFKIWANEASPVNGNVEISDMSFEFN